MTMLFMEALVAWTAFWPGPFSFSKFPNQPKDYGQAYPAILGQATTSAMGQREVALTIIVNEFGETSLANVYAGGDVVMWPYRNKLIHIEHWETAWSQGISIARNILNKRSNKYNAVPYFWTDQYDETFEYLGNARTWNKILTWGKMEEGKFAVAYVDENNFPLAILFANKFVERKDVQELLSKNQSLDESSFDMVPSS